MSMSQTSTTLRVSVAQRNQLRRLAAERAKTMTATLDDALTALKRQHFYDQMAASEAELRADAKGWADYLAERDAWLNPDLTGR